MFEIFSGIGLRLEKIRKRLSEILRRRQVSIKFIFTEPQYKPSTLEYLSIFTSRGDEIIRALEKYSGLRFTETRIVAFVGEYAKSHSGKKLSSAMLLRHNSRNKTATLMHELTHRLLMQHHPLWLKLKEKFKLNDVHQIINLILYPSLIEVLSRDMAETISNHESSLDLRYKKCWDWYKDPQNQKIIDEILAFIHRWPDKKNPYVFKN